MICQVCKEDHNKPTRKWCDRSQLEIENEYLKAELFRLREALEYYAELPEIANPKPFSARTFWNGNVARKALKGGE